VFRYLDTFLASGLTGLLAREHKGGHPSLGAADQAAFLKQLRAGKFRRAKEAQAWIKARTQRTCGTAELRGACPRLCPRLISGEKNAVFLFRGARVPPRAVCRDR